MPRLLRVFGLALLALVMFVPGASAQRGGFGGHGGFGGRGGFYGGRAYYGGGWGWYGPAWGWGWYGPYSYWGWYGYPYAGAYGEGYSAEPRYGDVKITDAAKDARVYIDGGYAGTAGDLKKFHLTNGSHEIELRDPSGHAFHQEKIEVLPGKTVEIQGNAGGH
jgi:hypothetical protein